MRTLVTPALRLQPLTAAYATAMFEVLRDPLLYAHEDFPPPQSVEELRERYTRLESRVSPDGLQDWLNWVMVEAPTGRTVGFVQATIERSNGDVWVAFMLAREFWGRGYAHEASQAMLDELVTRWGARRALATAERANARSIRLLQRLGFAESDDDERVARQIAPHDLLLTKAL